MKVPTALRRVTDGQETIELPEGTVTNALDILDSKYPGFKERILDDESGDVHPFISIFLNDNDIQYINKNNINSLILPLTLPFEHI